MESLCSSPLTWSTRSLNGPVPYLFTAATLILSSKSVRESEPGMIIVWLSLDTFTVSFTPSPPLLYFTMYPVISPLRCGKGTSLQLT